MAEFDVEIDEGEFIPLAEPLGYMVVRDEDGVIVADWDAEAHTAYDQAVRELGSCREDEPLYDWFLVELRRAGDA